MTTTTKRTRPATGADAGTSMALYPAATAGRTMTEHVQTVHIDASANEAAQLMWYGDLGALPVVDHEGKLRGMVTDRDLAMAAHLQGKPLHEIPVRTVMSQGVVALTSTDLLSEAVTLMRRHKVRRLPVLDERGGVGGMLSLSDLARVSVRGEGDGLTERDVADALCTICTPRAGLAADGADELPTLQS